jgi:hypothetical protein
LGGLTVRVHLPAGSAARRALAQDEE